VPPVRTAILQAAEVVIGSGEASSDDFDSALDAALASALAGRRVTVHCDQVTLRSTTWAQEASVDGAVVDYAPGKSVHVGEDHVAVLAQRCTSKAGRRVCVGVGWVVDAVTGWAVFTHASGDSSEEVRRLLDEHLVHAQRMARPGRSPLAAEHHLVEPMSDGRVTCAVAAAVFRSVRR
jgi:hypothetical protein